MSESERDPEHRDDVLRNPHEESWKPVAGPLPWERDREAVEATWTDGAASHEGIAVRQSGEEEAFICSTLFCPDIRTML